MFVQGGRGAFRKQMVLDCFFPPGFGEMEADLELFSVIFIIGSNDKYPDAESLCNLCPLHHAAAPVRTPACCTLPVAYCQMINPLKKSYVKTLDSSPNFGGIFDLLFWAVLGIIIPPYPTERLCE